jgi:hypothetical protein
VSDSTFSDPLDVSVRFSVRFAVRVGVRFHFFVCFMEGPEEEPLVAKDRETLLNCDFSKVD